MRAARPSQHPGLSLADDAAEDAGHDERLLEGVTVLAVDDDSDARDLIRRLLESVLAKVHVASSAAEALELLRRERPDVLVSDIGMPGEDGYALIWRVRELASEQGGDTPAVALTAFARSENRRRAFAAGFQAHLAKPVEPAELVTAVASLAGKKRPCRSWVQTCSRPLCAGRFARSCSAEERQMALSTLRASAHCSSFSRRR